MAKRSKGSKTPQQPKSHVTSSHLKPVTDAIWVTDFSDGDAESFRNDLYDFNQENPNKPVVIFIDTYGGEVYSLFAMIEILQEFKHVTKNEIPVVTVAVGKAMSCGAHLLAEGDIRVAYPNAKILLHRTSFGVSGHIKEVQISVKETEDNDYALNERLRQRIGFKGTLEEFHSYMANDKYLTSSDAKSIGLVDYVGYLKRIEQSVHAIKVEESEEVTIHRKSPKKRGKKR